METLEEQFKKETGQSKIVTSPRFAGDRLGEDLINEAYVEWLEAKLLNSIPIKGLASIVDGIVYESFNKNYTEEWPGFREIYPVYSDKEIVEKIKLKANGNKGR